MGADSSMYGAAFRVLKEVQFPDWPVYNGEQSISEVALRIIQENNIQPQDIVGGSSLGGIVAAEISRQIQVGKLLLIGSTLNPYNINPILRKLGSLSEISPVNMISIFVGKANLIFNNQLLAMFAKSDDRFIKAMCKAVFVWGGLEKPTCYTLHIHGAKDHIIHPPSRDAEIIPDGGHLIAMTHSEAVADFIKKNMEHKPI